MKLLEQAEHWVEPETNSQTPQFDMTLEQVSQERASAAGNLLLEQAWQF